MIRLDEFSEALSINGSSQHHNYLIFLKALRDAQIVDKNEAAMFLAVVLHESNGLTCTRTTDLAKEKVMTEYFGVYVERGFLKIFGIENYIAASQALKEDYVNFPRLIEKEKHAWKTSSWYWKTECQGYAPLGFGHLVRYGLRALNDSERDKVFENVCTAFKLTPKF
ncbi:chitinase [Brachionus plicatilis]|uniref:Chitinase n=1 Tax=Brachionus plicatilis TaxID=10195 RepID=A0A3M7SSX8_BRAPC|nr:chitinase [Brachionus plicatilis]